MDGSAAEPVPGLQHRESLQAMPLARWLLLTVLFFHSILQQTASEGSLPLPGAEPKAN